MKTYMASAETIEKKWFIVDASGKTLGRLASRLAACLRGKNKPEYTPHADAGDYYIVVNVDKLKVTGNKQKEKIYYRHSNYPGGLKAESFDKLHARKPERVLELAVQGMLPKGPLGRDMYRKLKIYAGSEHPHAAQNPEKVEEL
ncbi:MAG: 50S ribosomal protein L13 [Gammaproteobacteria bacterium CG_4_10_14_0_8_um_filter_38_16]|nr:MAG: 50S ribosomal protein L13 [Gammaproteobacteria bacterium CG_4_10_14_0_8_um_filter_38_16]PJA03825.1 MAG: 50S ribosomal protein L13 [Gammaproteobacteria bacterium CG_4_10_14_0_2_um_filter_38_22]PJB10799.1 MAG: 50S ribosomal protein L13 [Gammaproteobacteria bacterium CG_4_9_14_3_um_filter_38_9]